MITPRTINGPKGIWEDKFFLFFINEGKVAIKAIKDEKNKINGNEIHPNQKPIAAYNLASPSPIPSLFLIFLYKKIINQIIKYPEIPPIKELM